MSAFEPQIIAFCCSNCASSAANIAEKMQITLPENVRVIQLPCSGRLDTLHIMKALENGADGVYVAGCQTDSCQFKDGINKAEKKVAMVHGMLTDMGIEPERVAVYKMSAGAGQKFVDFAADMTAKVKELGPSPMK